MSATDNDRAMVLASFVADSLALGAHWIYDTALIEKQFGRVD
ncbi:MAG: ADP-ribosylglycohydrolase family protein, partial [Deltaproteobacteria bacterium]